MNFGMGYGDFMFTVFPAIFMTLFVVVFCFIIGTMAAGARRWHKNNQSPVLTVDASVVTKRQEVSHHRDINSDTWYYVTFQVESGDRMELGLSGSEYGLLAEGDRGRLTFQGTRFLGFERI